MEAVSLEEWQNLERRVSRSTTKALVETRKRLESQWADNPKRRAALAQTLPGWSDPDAPEFAPHPILGYGLDADDEL